MLDHWVCKYIDMGKYVNAKLEEHNILKYRTQHQMFIQMLFYPESMRNCSDLIS